MTTSAVITPPTHPALLGSLSSTAAADQIINFSPGPTSLPKEAEAKIADIFNTQGLNRAYHCRQPLILKSLAS